MSRIRRIFRHNIQWKLLALVSAFIIWLVVVNSSNPQVSCSVTIPFEVLNDKTLSTSSQIYTLSSDAVSVSYTVRQKFKNDITPDDFYAYIDLKDYSVSGDVRVYLEIDSAVSELITDITTSPSVIHVATESIQQKKFAVKPYLNGEVADGYIAGEASVNPEYIYVKGPVSVMGRISSVGINIDVSGRSEDLEGTTSVVFLDANGNQLSGIEDSLSFAGDINYSLPVYRIKPLSVNAFAGGAPASGYTVDSVETSPTFISVYGPEEILDQYSYILIPGSVINISGIDQNKTFIIDSTPYIPEGLKLAGQTPEITVYVKVRSIYDTPSAVRSEEPVTSVHIPETEETKKAETVQPESTEETSAPETSPSETYPPESEDSTDFAGDVSETETEEPMSEETLPADGN